MLVHSDVGDIHELRPLKQSVCCCVSYTLVLWYSINMMGIYMYYGTINKRLADSFPDKGMIKSFGLSSCFVFLHFRCHFYDWVLGMRIGNSFSTLGYSPIVVCDGKIQYAILERNGSGFLVCGKFRAPCAQQTAWNSSSY